MAVPFTYLRNVQAIGNSMMVGLPKIWVQANSIKKIDKLKIEAYADRLVITKLKK